MKNPATKSCDNCRDVIAIKDGLFFRFRTVKDYVTLRLDCVPQYDDFDTSTKRSKKHYCTKCWRAFWSKNS